jgi:hypothetical protein
MMGRLPWLSSTTPPPPTNTSAEAHLAASRASYAIRVNVLEDLLDRIAQAAEQTARELGHAHPAVTRITAILEERAQ